MKKDQLFSTSIRVYNEDGKFVDVFNSRSSPYKTTPLMLIESSLLETTYDSNLEFYFENYGDVVAKTLPTNIILRDHVTGRFITWKTELPDFMK